jgi:hypothetical protein
LPTDWTAADVAVGADGLTRILWMNRYYGMMAVWSVDSAGNPSSQSPIYFAPPGFRAHRITAGSDGLTRVLWTSAGDGALVWTLYADNAYQASFYLDSVPTSDSWDVSIRVAAVTGPDFCIWTPSVGTAFNGAYEVVRSGNSVSFIPYDPIGWPSFTAKMDGANFGVANEPFDSGQGMCVHYLQATSFSGSFSTDGSHFTATQTDSFTLDSGQVKTVTFFWFGSRR